MMMLRRTSVVVTAACFTLITSSHGVIAGHLRNEEGNIGVRRLEEALPPTLDPKTIQMKLYPGYQPDREPPISSDEFVEPFRFAKTPNQPASLRILALGTSFTWAHGVADKKRAYPFLLTEHPELVDNIALPATGADFPALCLESMLPDPNANYDLILVEFSQNQSDGLPFLLKRLHERFPDAMKLYVHVYSLVGEIVERETREFPFQYKNGHDPNVIWEWVPNTDGVGYSKTALNQPCLREVCHKDQLQELVEANGGTMFWLPMPKTPMVVIQQKWVVEDWLHLSYVGHAKVAQGIVLHMQRHKGQLSRQNKRLGSWELGDQCYNWYYTQNLRDNGMSLEFTNAIFHCRDKRDLANPGCALEIKGQDDAMTAVASTITFESRFDVRVPVAIGYRSQQFPPIYPNVHVSLNDEVSHFIDPSLNRSTRNGNGQSPHHVNAYYYLGWAEPHTTNVITVTALTKAPSPFKVAGIYLCGACAMMADGDMGIGSINHDLDAIQES